MYDEDPGLAPAYAPSGGRFTHTIAGPAPAPQFVDAGRSAWFDLMSRRGVALKKTVDMPSPHYQLQESISPAPMPVVPGYRRAVSDGAGVPASSARVRARRTLVAIPCYNEAVAIGSLVLMARRYVDEVLVVDDGCTDDTARVAGEAGATVVSHGSQQGKGRAVKTALHYAFEHSFDVLVFMDGDGQHNPEEIPLLLEPIMADTADIVIGFRSMDQMPLYRRFGRAVLDIATGAGGTITDSQCGFRALNRRSIEHMFQSLKKDDFSTESEMIRVAREKHLRIGETPVLCRYGDIETSTKNPFSHGFEVLGALFWLMVDKRPLLYMGGPGMIAMLAGVFLGVQFFQLYNKEGYFSVGYGLLASVFFIPGVIALLMGMILDVTSRMR